MGAKFQTPLCYAFTLGSPLTITIFGSSRGLPRDNAVTEGNEVQISLEAIIYLEPPHVGCHFFSGLLGIIPSGPWNEFHGCHQKIATRFANPGSRFVELKFKCRVATCGRGPPDRRAEPFGRGRNIGVQFEAHDGRRLSGGRARRSDRRQGAQGARWRVRGFHCSASYPARCESWQSAGPAHPLWKQNPRRRPLAPGVRCAAHRTSWLRRSAVPATGCGGP